MSSGTDKEIHVQVFYAGLQDNRNIYDNSDNDSNSNSNCDSNGDISSSEWITAEDKKKETVISIPIEDIVESSFEPPFLMQKGKYSISLKNGNKYTAPVTRKNFEKVYALRNMIDEKAKINTFQPDTFRTAYVYNHSVDNVISGIIVIPLGILQLIGGIILIAYIGVIVLVAAIPLILMGLGMIFFTLHNIKNSCEGKCPICNKNVKLNKSAKFFYCTKCKEKVRIEKEYLEVR